MKKKILLIAFLTVLTVCFCCLLSISVLAAVPTASNGVPLEWDRNTTKSVGGVVTDTGLYPQYKVNATDPFLFLREPIRIYSDRIETAAGDEVTAEDLAMYGLTFTPAAPNGEALICVMGDVHVSRIEILCDLKMTVGDGNGKLILHDALLFGSDGGNYSVSLSGNGGKTLIVSPALDQNGKNEFRPITVRPGNTFYLQGGTVLTGSRFTGNGGMVFVDSGAVFSMLGGSISDCQAESGGAVCVENGGSFRMIGGSVTNCLASAAGGAVYSSGSAVIQNSASVSGCRATGASVGKGGAICSVGGSLTISGGSLTGNAAAFRGGAIYLASGTTAVVNGGSISANSCSAVENAAGGGIFCGGALTVGGSVTVTGNTINGKASDVYLDSSVSFAVESVSTGMQVGLSLSGVPADGKLVALPIVSSEINILSVFTLENPDGYYLDVKESQLVCLEKISIDGATVIYDTVRMFNGRMQTVDVAVVVEGITLTDAADYSVTGNKAMDFNPSGYDLTISGIGKYRGTLTKHYSITPCTVLTAENVLTPSDIPYTGEKVVPGNVIIVYNDTILIEDVDYTYALENNANAGQGTIRITLKGNYSGTLVKPFNIILTGPASDMLVEPIAEMPYTGAAVCPPLVVKVNGRRLLPTVDYDFEYENNTQVGIAKVSIVFKKDFQGSVYKEFSIVPKNDLSASDVSDISPRIFSGSPVCPTVTVTDGKKVLSSSTDYVLSYKNNAAVGTATVIIDLRGNYSGKIEKNFEIIPEKPKTVITVSDLPECVYSGTEQKPSPSVYKDGVLLSFGDDYTVSYTNNINVGTATVIVTVKDGDFLPVEKTFFIVPCDLSKKAFAETIEEQEYTGEEIKPSPVVYDGLLKLVEGRDYTVSYSNNIEEGVASIVISFCGNYTGTFYTGFDIFKEPEHNYSVEGLYEMSYTGEPIVPVFIVKDNGVILNHLSYSVEVTNNVNIGTAKIVIRFTEDPEYVLEKTFEIVPYLLGNNAVRDIEPVEYNGGRFKPVPVISDGVHTLVEGRDYEVSYGDNIDVGYGTVNVQYMGNYTGIAQLKFAILPKTLTEDNIATFSDCIYSGSSYTPNVVAHDGNLLLTKGTDYNVTYSNNVEVGTASVFIEFFGKYRGEITKTFEILPISVEAGPLTASIEKTEFIFTGEAIRPEITVKCGDVDLVENRDYILSYENNILPGTAEVTVLFIGSYEGELSQRFVIRKASVFGVDERGNALPVFIWTDNGFDADLVLHASVTSGTDVDPKAFRDVLKRSERVELVYALQLTKGEQEIREITNGTATDLINVFLILPESLHGKDFRLWHVHGTDEVSEIVLGDQAGIGTYLILDEGDLLTQVDRFSEFVFVVKKDVQLGFWLMIAAIVLVVIGILVFLYFFLKKKYGKDLLAFLKRKKKDTENGEEDTGKEGREEKSGEETQEDVWPEDEGATQASDNADAGSEQTPTEEAEETAEVTEEPVAQEEPSGETTEAKPEEAPVAEMETVVPVDEPAEPESADAETKDVGPVVSVNVEPEQTVAVAAAVEGGSSDAQAQPIVEEVSTEPVEMVEVLDSFPEMETVAVVSDPVPEEKAKTSTKKTTTNKTATSKTATKKPRTSKPKTEKDAGSSGTEV